MSDLTIVREPTPIEKFMTTAGSELTPQERERLMQQLRDANPHTRLDGFVPAMTPIIVPNESAVAGVPRPVQREVAELAYTSIPERQVLDEGLGLLGGARFEAVAEVLAEYGPLSASSDSNTMGAGASTQARRQLSQCRTGSG